MFPETCGWMVFIFLIPVFYIAFNIKKKISFALGMWWGICFFACHLVAAAIVLMQKAEGSFRLLPWFFFVLYLAAHAALWLYALSHYNNSCKHISAKILTCSFVTWIYFFYMRYIVFWPCGSLVGYCFSFPLLPLAVNPTYLTAMHIVGSLGLLFLLILGQACLAGFLAGYTKVIGGAFFSIFFFIFPWKHTTSFHAPAYIQQLCYAQPPPYHIYDPLERAEEINIQITKALARKPSALCILMPESSCPFFLNTFPEVIRLWGYNALSQDHILCIGSYRADACFKYNTLFMIKKCRIIDFYDKSFLMPIVEFIPSFLKKIICIKELFLKSHSEFSPRRGTYKPLLLTKSFYVYPLICSDVYMRPLSLLCEKGTNNNFPILLIVNDAWFSLPYAQKLMFLFAKYYAIENKKDLIYIGHFFGCWISNLTGKTILL